jgi:hypothetical protein
LHKRLNHIEIELKKPDSPTTMAVRIPKSLAMKTATLALLTVLIVPVFGSADDGITDILKEEEWSISNQTMNLAMVQSELEKGNWSPNLAGAEYEFTSRPGENRIAYESSDGEIWQISQDYLDFPFQEFWIEDESQGLKGTASLTKIGITLLVHGKEKILSIDPPQNGTTTHIVQSGQIKNEEFLELSLLESESGIQAVGDRTVKLTYDRPAGNSGSCASCHVSNTFSNVRSIFDNHFTWNLFGPSIYSCTTDACDLAVGYDSTETDYLAKLHNYILEQSGFRTGGGGSEYWELNMGFTGLQMGVRGQPLSVIYGVAILPGHYTMVIMKDVGVYDYRSSAYEAATNLAHEVGHNFNARHHTDQASRSVYEDTCTIIEIAGQCLFPKSEYQYTEITRKLMHEDPKHEPPQWIAADTFQNSRKTTINNCNLGTNWDNLSYTSYQNSGTC